MQGVSPWLEEQWLRRARRTRSVVPIATVARALWRYAEGDPIDEIAAEAIVDRTTVNGWRRRSGMKPRPSTADADLLPAARVEEILDLYRELGSTGAVAERVGRTQTSVLAQVRRHAPELLRPQGGQSTQAPEGWETAAQHGARHGRCGDSVTRAIARGVYPEARRHRTARGVETWILPAHTPDRLRRAPRRTPMEA